MANEKYKTDKFGSTVTTVDIDGVSVHVYYPLPNAADTSCVKLVKTAPFYLVFGDGPMTAEECFVYANETGLAQVAAQNGSVINFVQPKGNAWNNEVDADSYGIMVTHIDFNSGHNYKYGISNERDFFTGQTKVRIMGSSEMIYVYGSGRGADLIANNWLRSLTFPGILSDKTDYTIAGVTLEKLSDVSKLLENDIPLVSVGNSDEVNKALEEANTNGLMMIAADQDFKIQAQKLANVYRRQSSKLIKRTDYQKLGIIEKEESYKVITSKDNPDVKEEYNPINYITYYSEDLEVERGGQKVPLVLTLHGGGNNAVYQAFASEWPEIGKEYGFITVAVDDHTSHPATEIISLVKHLQDEYPIDPTRIYVSGFSMGGLKTWDLLQEYAQVFAGFAPMHAGFGPYTDSYMRQIPNINTKLVVPVFYVGGENTPFPEFPCNKGIDGGPNPLREMLAYTFKLNGVPAEYQFDEKENPWWGVAPDLFYQVRDKEIFTDSVININLYKNSEGKYYTAYANAAGEGHEVFGRDSWVAWDFLRQFKRLSDGSIEITKVEYSMIADDGSITNNNYNR